MKDTDIIAAIAPDAVSLMDKAIAEIKRLRQENATLTAERDHARRMYCEATLIVLKDGTVAPFHEWLNGQDPNWPKSGKGTSYITV